MCPEPALELAHPRAWIKVGHPSCRQTTDTSFVLQPFPHTVPHFSWIFSSTLPLQLFSPPVSLSSFFMPPAVTVEHGKRCSTGAQRAGSVFSLLTRDLASELRPVLTPLWYKRRMLSHSIPIELLVPQASVRTMAKLGELTAQ